MLLHSHCYAPKKQRIQRHILFFFPMHILGASFHFAASMFSSNKKKTDISDVTSLTPLGCNSAIHWLLVGFLKFFLPKKKRQTSPMLPLSHCWGVIRQTTDSCMFSYIFFLPKKKRQTSLMLHPSQCWAVIRRNIGSWYVIVYFFSKKKKRQTSLMLPHSHCWAVIRRSIWFRWRLCVINGICLRICMYACLMYICFMYIYENTFIFIYIYTCLFKYMGGNSAIHLI